MNDNIADHCYRYSRRKRETNHIQRRIWTYNESKYIRKLVQTFSAKEKRKKKYESRDVRIHANLKREKMIVF